MSSYTLLFIMLVCSVPYSVPFHYIIILSLLNSGSLIRNNYEALVSHVERLTHTDAMRMLNVARSHAQQRMGRRPRTPQEYARVMESMGDALLFSAIMGPPGITSYEVSREVCVCMCGN